MINKPVLSRLYLFPATALLTLMGLSTPHPVMAGEPAPPAGGAVILFGSPEGIRVKTTGAFPPGHAADERLFEIGSITLPHTHVEDTATGVIPPASQNPDTGAGAVPNSPVTDTRGAKGAPIS